MDRPDYVIPHLEKLLISRGAAKALEIRKELHCFHEEFSRVYSKIASLAPQVAALSVPAENLVSQSSTYAAQQSLAAWCTRG